MNEAYVILKCKKDRQYSWTRFQYSLYLYVKVFLVIQKDVINSLCYWLMLSHCSWLKKRCSTWAIICVSWALYTVLHVECLTCSISESVVQMVPVEDASPQSTRVVSISVNTRSAIIMNIYLSWQKHISVDTYMFQRIYWKAREAALCIFWFYCTNAFQRVTPSVRSLSLSLHTEEGTRRNVFVK